MPMVIPHTQASQMGWGHFQATGGIVGLLFRADASLKAKTRCYEGRGKHGEEGDGQIQYRLRD